MALITGILGNPPQLVNGQAKVFKPALDAVYRHSAILLNDAISLLGFSISAPIPLVGFTYEHPSEMTLLQYSYSEYPYLNKALISNTMIKEATNVTIKANRAITSVSGLLTNIALNEAVYALLEKYCDRGGTFSILSMWGTQVNLVLERLTTDGGESGPGVGFVFHFRKYVTDLNSVETQVSNSINALTQGIVG